MPLCILPIQASGVLSLLGYTRCSKHQTGVITEAFKTWRVNSLVLKGGMKPRGVRLAALFAAYASEDALEIPSNMP